MHVSGFVCRSPQVARQVYCAQHTNDQNNTDNDHFMFSLLKRACCEQHNKRVHVYTGLTDDSVSQWKGKGILGLSPLLQYAVEQPSSLDHTKPGCWVWWKLEEATWMLAKVVSFSCCKC